MIPSFSIAELLDRHFLRDPSGWHAPDPKSEPACRQIGGTGSPTSTDLRESLAPAQRHPPQNSESASHHYFLVSTLLFRVLLPFRQPIAILPMEQSVLREIEVLA